MARGLGGSYGARTEGHPRRSGAPPGPDFDDFSGGEFPSPPVGPPQSEQPGRGVMTDPNTQDYAPVTGEPGMFYTPDRMMKIGAFYRSPTSPPQSEQPRRGVNATRSEDEPAFFERPTLSRFPGTGEGLESVQPNPVDMTEWWEENQPPNFNENGYLGPVARYINDTQFTPS